jgi:hypothetical protein
MIQKVKTARRGESKKHASRPPAKLERTTFTTSRVMDFFSEKELVTQTGHGREEWPLVLVKELIDNALDACEESAVPPVIEVHCDAAGIAVADNGPGLPETLLLKQMDFGVRASNREVQRARVGPHCGCFQCQTPEGYRRGACKSDGSSCVQQSQRRSVVYTAERHGVRGRLVEYGHVSCGGHRGPGRAPACGGPVCCG